MAIMAVGADLGELKALYGPRVTTLRQQFTTPVDELGRSVQRAEQELQRLRQRQLDETQQLWARYKPGYERYLHAAPEPEGGDLAEPAAAVPSAEADDSSPGADAEGTTSDAHGTTMENEVTS
jgi:hypothetical protein